MSSFDIFIAFILGLGSGRPLKRQESSEQVPEQMPAQKREEYNQYNEYEHLNQIEKMDIYRHSRAMYGML